MKGLEMHDDGFGASRCTGVPAPGAGDALQSGRGGRNFPRDGRQPSHFCRKPSGGGMLLLIKNEKNQRSRNSHVM